MLDLAAVTEPFVVEGRNIVLLPANGKYDEIIPDDAKLVVLKGHPFHAVANTPDFGTVLYNFGCPVPSPIYFDDWDWSGVEIFTAQAQMAGLLTARNRCYNLSALGTGKSIGSLLAVDWMLEKKYIRRCLILAPLSILWVVWQKEIVTHFPRLRPIILHGPREKRASLLKSKNWNVAILNHDGIKVILQELLDARFEMMVVDEAATFRDTRTAKWKVLNQLVKQTKYVSALTGSPTPNAPSDAYGLARMFTPHTVPKSFRTFRQMVEIEVQQNRWTPRKNAAETVARVLQPAVRFKRSDVIELKDHSITRQKVTLSDKQANALHTLKREAIVRFPEGTVDAPNAAVLMGKALQICSGAVYASDRAVINLEPVHRIEVLRTIIESAEGKVIVLVPYLHLTKLLEDQLGVPTLVVTGAVSPKDRTKIFRKFQDRNDPSRVLLAHPKVLAHGVNLTTANTTVWFAPIHSRETFEQANARIMRMGQTLEQYIICLTSGREENAVYKVLENKGTFQDAVLEIFALRTKGVTKHETAA